MEAEKEGNPTHPQDIRRRRVDCDTLRLLGGGHLGSVDRRDLDAVRGAI